MSKPKAVLLYSHDWSYAFTKTTEVLADACERLGVPALVRDSCDARTTRQVTEHLEDPSVSKACETDIAQRLNLLIKDFQIEAVISLDLGWLTLPDYFLDQPQIKRIYSIWFDDFISWCGAPNNAVFPLHKRTFPEILGHEKVFHCFYGQAMAREASRLGFDNQLMSALAAPKEFLEASFPCTVKDKLAFIGNPGSRQLPSKDIVKYMQEDAPLEELRKLSCQELFSVLNKDLWDWMKGEDSVKKLIGTAIQFKAEHPYISALEIIEICGQKYPEALEFLNQSFHILEAAHFVKLVNRYDRPALVSYLYRKGLLEVISNVHEWEPYGVKALDSVFADELPQWYMKYPAHVNAANPIRDATANEKLFEMSACGRASINLDSPDVRACYDENEIYLVQSLEEAADTAQTILADPEKALTKGKRARRKTALAHTWEHRLAAMFEHLDDEKTKTQN